MKLTEKVLSPTVVPIGSVVQDNGVSFSIFSEYAIAVSVVLFDTPDGPPTKIVPLIRQDNNIWYVFIDGLKAGQLYGYKVDGEYNPRQGKRFNASKLLLDPYAKAVTGKFHHKENLIFAYDLNSPDKDLTINKQENYSFIPKSVVIEDDFDWEGDKPLNIPMDRLIIYEAHVKGFTKHPSSGVSSPGTYAGFVEKIPYLKSLGINAVELMPIHEFYIRSEMLDKGLSDYWGYNTIGFFAPESSYSSQSSIGCQVNEFKTLVKKLHRAGIEVILDVVYNHTGEGNEQGPTLCFKGIDNPTYYKLQGTEQEPYRYYMNDSGCGNTFDVEHPEVMKFVLDSLRYWAKEMHVDGFRFDLASLLTCVHGEFSQDSLFFDAVAKDPILSKVKLIAEPWDTTTYQVGNFPKDWSEWNGKFRDTMRKFIKGDEGQVPEVASRIVGSADFYERDGKKPFNSINFITCHDGFTLWDLFSYNEKHNEANHEDNKDGNNDNSSWNCGLEGPTEDPQIRGLRIRLVKNALFSLLFSAGTPMILSGDEILQTHNGNNNVYCQDNELNWFNWSYVDRNHEIIHFVRKAIAIRRHYPVLQRKRFFSAKEIGPDQVPDISWFDDNLQMPQWDNPQIKTLCYQMVGTFRESNKPYYLFFILNSDHNVHEVTLPPYEGTTWFRLVDTWASEKEAIYVPGEEEMLDVQNKYSCQPRSFVLLVGR